MVIRWKNPELERWKKALMDYRVCHLTNGGHFVCFVSMEVMPITYYLGCQPILNAASQDAIVNAV